MIHEAEASKSPSTSPGAGQGVRGARVVRGMISRPDFMMQATTRSSAVTVTAALWTKLRASVRSKVSD